jgi:hypothetical protein
VFQQLGSRGSTPCLGHTASSGWCKTDCTHTFEPARALEGLRVHLVNNVLPEHLQDPAPYELPYGMHPDALANELLARYVARVALDLSSPPPSSIPRSAGVPTLSE